MKEMNRIVKVIITSTIAILMILIGNETFATTNNKEVVALGNAEVIRVADGDMQTIINAGEEWINNGKKSAEEQGLGDPLYFVDQLAGVGQLLVAIGIATLVIVGGVMAIKWATATPEKAAKLKTQLIGLVVAAVVIFGAFGIWNLVRGIGQNVEDKLTAKTPSVIMAETGSTNN